MTQAEKYLYPCFKWPGTIWFYSDPHFSDPDMLYFRSENVTDDFQVKEINKKVAKTDTIVILGDIGNTEYIKKLKGYKVLIQGNHDAGASKYQRQIIDGKDNHLFDEVYSGCLMISDKIILSHEPVDFPYAFNIHGHVHRIERQKLANKLNVCAESIHYSPIALSQIIKSGILHDVPNIHRITIDKASEKNKNISKNQC